MALLYIDGFEEYDTSTVASTWYEMATFNSNTSAPYFLHKEGTVYSSATQSRTTQTTITGKSLYFDDGVLSLKLPTISTLYVGFAAYHTSVTSATPICGFCLNANHTYPSNPNHGVRLILNADSTISLKNNNTGATIATSTSTLTVNTWQYLEIKYVFGSGTSGSFQVKVNGADYINQASIDTACTAASVNCFYFHHYATTATYRYVDDFYVCDDTGTTNNTFLGAIKVYTLIPTANSATVELTASAGNNYACVDEIPANTTDYVTATASNQVDLYTMADLPGGATISSVPGVLVKVKAMNTTASNSQIQMALRYSGISAFGNSLSAIQGSYCINYEVFQTQPDGSAWSSAAITGVEAGIKVV